MDVGAGWDGEGMGWFRVWIW